MVKKSEKVAEIKIRISTEDKDLIKKAAALQAKTMSKFILELVVPTAKSQLELIEYKRNIEDRIVSTEVKIQNLKMKMESKKMNNKKSILKNIFARKS